MAEIGSGTIDGESLRDITNLYVLVPFDEAGMGTRPGRARNRTVLPAPLGPVTANASPCFSVKETFLRTGQAVQCDGKVFNGEDGGVSHLGLAFNIVSLQ